jgi:Tfp pilus assembly protein PilF
VTRENPFAFSGKERDLFVASLRSFSDNCEAPDLTPDCPFYEVTASGPICGEQCLDVLAEHGRHIPQRSVAWNLGEGLVAYEKRKRHRRGPEPTARPFDASMIRMHDKDRPTDSKRTVSLFGELEHQLRLPPHIADDLEERNYLIRACFEELERRGFALRDLLNGAATVVASGIAAYLAVDIVLRDAEVSPGEDVWRVDPRWTDVQDAWLPPEERNGPAALARFLSQGFLSNLIAWMRTRTIEDLAAWRPPTTGFLLSFIDNGGGNGTERGTWMFNRFSQTYYKDWTTSSLDLEWQYLHGLIPGCGPAAEMTQRRADANEVAKEIANRAVSQRKEDSGTAASRALHASDFTLIAVDYLAAGRHEAAAAIFESIDSLRPNDPDVLNNLGFCLIPQDPARALAVLEKSVSVARRPSAITHANLVLVHLLLGNFDQAAELAARTKRLPAERDTYLWAREDGVLILRGRMQTDLYVDALMTSTLAAPAA